MRLLHLPFIAIALVGNATPIFAEAANGGFSVRGIGAQNCSTLAEAVAADTTGTTLEYLAAWSAGYVTHANRTSSGIYEAMPVTDNRVLARVLIALCQVNPQALTETVLASLMDALAHAAVTAEPETLDLTNNDQQVVIPHPTFVLVQQELVSRGLLPDESTSVDGRYGPQSRDALIAHQRAAGLAETGLPDPATLLSLLSKDQ